MRDNGNDGGSHGGAGQIRPVHWSRTEHQVRPFDGFKPEEVSPRTAQSPATADGYTMRLATPPKWTHAGGMPCLETVPKGHARDPFDTTDEKRAAALCAGCPLVAACLSDALVEEAGLGYRSRYLVRGGLTPRGRAAHDPTLDENNLPNL